MYNWILSGTILVFAAVTFAEDSPATYGGRSADASWRAEARARIERIRKAPLKVQVVDAQGKPIRGAKVHVQQQRHAFGFGNTLNPRAFQLEGETIHTLIYRNVPATEPRLVISPVVESVAVGRERDFRVIYHDGSGRSRDVTHAASVTWLNDHASVSAGKVRGLSLGSSPVVAEYLGRKAQSLFHVFEHPIKPLSNRWDTEHAGGYYLSVSPSSVTLVVGETRNDFVLTLHPEGDSPREVAPTAVLACQPDKVKFSGTTTMALAVGPAALDFVYRIDEGDGRDLHAICYVTVVSGR